MQNLCLGTAQFGLDYGITNSSGKISIKTVKEMLAIANSNGIVWIDTAQAYGTAEEVLGHAMPKTNNFKIINKLRKISNPEIRKEDINAMGIALQVSLKNLGRNEVDTLLIHDASDLRKKGGDDLCDWLKNMKKKGIARRIGVSIYTQKDLEGIDTEVLEAVQLPISLYDQRTIKNSTLKNLYHLGSSIHARSIYLQGLIATESVNWPNWIPLEIIKHHQRLENLAITKGCKLIDLAIGFIKEQKELELSVIGTCDTTQLTQLIDAWEKDSPWKNEEWKTFGLKTTRILDPRTWPK